MSNNMKIKQLAQQIASKRIHEDKEINDRIDKSNLIKTKPEKIIFLKEYAKRYPYPNNYINNELLSCATPTKKFSDFIIWLVKKDPYLLHRDVLNKIYNHDKKTFEKLWKELSKSKDDVICATLGLILGGMGREDPKQLFELITQKKIVEFVLVEAIRDISFEREIPDEIISIILSYTNSKNDDLKFNAIHLLVNRFHKNPKIFKKIIQLAKTDDKTKDLVAKSSASISRDYPDNALLLLQQCAKTYNQNLILNSVSTYLGFVTMHCPMECLVILKNWMRKFGNAIMGVNINFIAEQIGKSKKINFNDIEKFLLKWINTLCMQNKPENEILEFALPHLIDQIYNDNKLALFTLIEKIDYKQKKKKDVIVRIIETFFSNSYEEIPKQLNTDCYGLLEKIAKHYDFDTTLEKNLPSPTMETLALVRNIRLSKKSIDPTSTKKNLDQFPNIIKFLTKRKLCNLIDKQRNHPLALLLSRSKITKKAFKQIVEMIEKTDDDNYTNRLVHVLIGKYHSHIILADLDQILSDIKPEGTKEIKSLLLNEGFSGVLTQLNIYSKFKKEYDVTLEPQLKRKKVDLCVKIEEQDYYFELYQPKSPQRQELEYMNTASLADKRKHKSKIIHKFEDQLADTIHLESPVILVIDNEHVSTTNLEIMDLLNGTMKFVMTVDNKKQEINPKLYTRRENDSFNEQVKNGNLLSAAILLNRDIDHSNLKVRLQGKIYENPGAKFPIDERILKKIEDSLFNTGM